VWQGSGVERGVVVVGGSLAGLRAIETLRNDGFDGPVTLIGAEARQPYDRPPLSKKVLAGEWEPDRIALRRDGDLGSLDVDPRLGRSATALDLERRVVTTDDGEEIAFDGIVIATGAVVRRLPGQPELEGVHVLRTLEDSLALRAALTTGSPRVVVVGAGFIGSEVAATARGIGCEVTVLEALPVPLARALGPRMGLACSMLHGDHGVDLRVGVGVDAIEGAGGRVEAVRLSDGSTVEADVVVVGVGVAPATAWLEDSGLELRDGVVCDATLAAGPPGVYAAGDVCRWTNELFGEEMRIEHWTNAAEQGAAAAANLLSDFVGVEPIPYAPVPFFWSDQFDSRIQYVGRAHGDDEVQVVAGDIDGNFMAMYGHGGRLRGVLGVNMPKLVMRCRKLLAERASWEDAIGHAQGLAQ